MPDKLKPTSFKIPSRYIVFMDYLAREAGTTRTGILLKILDAGYTTYLKQKQQGTNNPFQ